jgi:hypothetical protein
LIQGFTISTVGDLTAITYNGVDITAFGATNAGTGHVPANMVRFVVFQLGANAGNHTFNIQWSTSHFFFFQAIAGNGDIDAAVLDAAVTDGPETNSISNPFTPSPYTPVTDKALPLFLPIPSNFNVGGGSFTAQANCTLITNTPVGTGVFYGPLSTPAGTATSATMNDGAVEFQETLTFALRPTASANTDTTWMVRQQRPMANFFPTIVKVP